MSKSALRSTGSTRQWTKIKQRILRRDQFICQYCGQEADTVDHVVPRRLGGLDNDENLVAACRRCNLAKGGRFFVGRRTPAWNVETQSLEFRMAALHQLPDGKTFKGNYTLQIPTEVAKCLWGANASMGTASIRILDEDGEQKIATISSSISKEYFRFSAYGFHFSSPRISVAFKAPIAKKSTITCIKGKLSKKVTAVKPKCPSGYKKK